MPTGGLATGGVWRAPQVICVSAPEARPRTASGEPGEGVFTPLGDGARPFRAPGDDEGAGTLAPDGAVRRRPHDSMNSRSGAAPLHEGTRRGRRWHRWLGPRPLNPTSCTIRTVSPPRAGC